MWSDQVYGWCMDAMLKYHACDYSDSRNENCEPVYMYEFAHRSEYETLPFWMGSYPSICFCTVLSMIEMCNKQLFNLVAFINR